MKYSTTSSSIPFFKGLEKSFNLENVTRLVDAVGGCILII